MKKNLTSSISRRGFLKGAAGAAMCAPSIVPSSVFGANAPSNRINIGCIGVGRMGLGDIRGSIGFDNVRIIAVCDVDSKRVANAKKRVEKHYADKTGIGDYKGCKGYGDFRDLIAREDIDAVQIVTPDHWHAIPAIQAAKAGKDIFLQKPLTYTVEEGRALCKAVKQYGRVLQVGSQQRSSRRFRFACELVRNGRIGKVHTVKVGIGLDPSTTAQPVMPVPENLDYDMWLGPAPLAPYTEKRVHPQKDYGRPGWLRISDYSYGMITGWGSHHLDITQWGLGMEDSGPVAVKGHAEYPQEGLWDVHGKFHIEYTYENGVKVLLAGNEVYKQGVRFEGSEGWVHVNRRGISAGPESLLKSVIGANEIHLYKSTNHKANWFECIKSREETVAPVENGHRSCTVCNIGHISMKLDRGLKWNPKTERFEDDAAANRLLSRPMRGSWHI
jgi:myo-inositol 2-dehydrogenase / D-chiro-inositol 1-dehydrogenase